MNTYFQSLVIALRDAGSDSPLLEARIIAEYLNNNSSEWTVEQKKIAEKIIAERSKHKPLCKILGEKGFYKYNFIVSEDVLSPRPDTEILVEAAIAEAKQTDISSILDLGTGSGCIILSILGDIETLQGVAVDVSSKALDIAKSNAERLNLSSRVSFIQASWFDEDLPERLGHKFDLIVSNPPYIATHEIAELEAEVRDYDPLSALDGGEDGFFHYRQIAKLSAKIINQGGLIMLEGGLNQEQKIADIFIAAGFSLQKILADYSGINRCIILKK